MLGISVLCIKQTPCSHRPIAYTIVIGTRSNDFRELKLLRLGRPIDIARTPVQKILGAANSGPSVVCRESQREV